jgi:hypothetical protein
LVILSVGLVVPTVGFVVTTVVFVIHILPYVGSNDAIVCSYRGYIGQKVIKVGKYQTNAMYSDTVIIHAVLLNRYTH